MMRAILIVAAPYAVLFLILQWVMLLHAQERATQVPPKDEWAPPKYENALASPHWFRFKDGFGLYFVFPRGAPSFCNCSPVPAEEPAQ